MSAFPSPFSSSQGSARRWAKVATSSVAASSVCRGIWSCCHDFSMRSQRSRQRSLSVPRLQPPDTTEVLVKQWQLPKTTSESGDWPDRTSERSGDRRECLSEKTSLRCCQLHRLALSCSSSEVNVFQKRKALTRSHWSSLPRVHQTFMAIGSSQQETIDNAPLMPMCFVLHCPMLRAQLQDFLSWSWLRGMWCRLEAV